MRKLAVVMHAGTYVYALVMPPSSLQLSTLPFAYILRHLQENALSCSCANVQMCKKW